MYWLKNDCENAVDDNIDAAMKHKDDALWLILHLPSAPIVPCVRIGCSRLLAVRNAAGMRPLGDVVPLVASPVHSGGSHVSYASADLKKFDPTRFSEIA